MMAMNRAEPMDSALFFLSILPVQTRLQTGLYSARLSEVTYALSTQWRLD